MLLRIYACIITLAFCFLLLTKNSQTKIIKPSSASQKLIEENLTTLSDSSTSYSDLCSLQVNEENLKLDIDFGLERIKKHVEITAEQEQQLIEYFKNERLGSYFIIPENDTSVETIIGKEKNDLVEKKENEHFAKSNIYNTKKQARYLSKVLRLDEEKEELLISLLSSDDLYRESENAYISKQLNLNQSQENEIYSLYHDYMENYDSIINIAKKMSIDVEAENFDYFNFGKNLFIEKAKTILDESQQQKLDQYFEEQKEF